METLDAPAAVGSAVVAAPVAPVADSSAWTAQEVRANAGWAIFTSAALLLVFCVLRFLPQLGWPLVLAAFGAYLFDPVVGFLARRGLSRTLATALLLGGGALVGVGTIFLVLPMALAQVDRFPGYLARALAVLGPQAQALVGQPMPADFAQLATLASAHAEQIVTRLLPTAGNVLGVVLGGSLSVLSFVLGALVVPVVGFYLLRGWPGVVQGAEELVPVRHRGQVRLRMAEIDRMLNGFIRGQLTMAAVLSVLYSATLSLIGLKLAIVVGLVTGIGNLVPYVGTATGVLLASAFCLVDFGADYHLALVVGTFALLVAADGTFITPKIVGDRVGLSPAAVIVAVLACGALFGFAGVLLAVPSAAILKLVARVGVACYRHSKVYRGA